jgi:hypothetical protein
MAFAFFFSCPSFAFLSMVFGRWFSVIDYHEVAPETGTWRDVAELKQSASLMFDFVCNHMSAKSAWFANYLKQMPGYDDFFISVDPETDLSAVTRPRALPLLTPFTLMMAACDICGPPSVRTSRSQLRLSAGADCDGRRAAALPY